MYSLNRMTLKAGGLAVVAAFVLAACTVVVDDRPGGPPPPRPGGPPQMCTFEYAPVCGQRGNDRQTFGNACLARVDGYRIIGDGECRRGGPGHGPVRPPEICTREYAPVCATRRGETRTFGNACEAGAAEYRIIRPGTC